MRGTPEPKRSIGQESTTCRSGGISRRQLLRDAAAVSAAATIVSRHVLGGEGNTPPSEKPTLAGIGVGGVGHGQMKACDSVGFQVVALCDVDEVYAKKSFDNWPQARRYRDYRELLDAEKDVDAVYVGTPDHSHAVICLAALEAGKHLCCVKPLTRTVKELRKVVGVAREKGVATQVTASPNTSAVACRTCELIAAEAIGTVREVHIWSNRPLWPQGMQRPEGEDPIPKTFDWDLWLGPARVRPFKAEWPDGHYAVAQVKSNRNPRRAVYHPWNFRGWWDFGTGALGDMGCHHANTPYRALNLTQPTAVEASATMVFAETAPLASIVNYDFPEHEGRPPVRLVWYDGGLRPPRPKQLEGANYPSEGTMYLGDEGVMLGSTVYPLDRGKKFLDVPETLPRRPGTWGEWIEAVRGGEPAGCNFDWAERITEFVLLGNLAIRVGQPLSWDARADRFSNSDQANAMLHDEYREGWTL
ncbi:MAG: Gfo/Idh/MocA family oxidoreductase [Planctomycetaceae bacterium]|nr:Gfo/Idh/MocA family oxidoreductase [Planctomycetaceae bacterium]